MKTMTNRTIINLILLLFGLSACSNPVDTVIEELQQDHSELKYGGELRTIVSSNFERFILIENASIDFCKNSIIEYCELNVLEENKNTSQDYDKHQLKLCRQGNWLIIKIPEEFSFYDYHNLVGWVWDSQQTFGFSIHKDSPKESYYIEMDVSDNYGDVLVGSDKGENSLYTYLPEAYIKGGNLRVTSEIEYSYSEALGKLSSSNIDLSSNGYIWESFDVKLFY